MCVCFSPPLPHANYLYLPVFSFFLSSKTKQNNKKKIKNELLYAMQASSTMEHNQAHPPICHQCPNKNHCHDAVAPGIIISNISFPPIQHRVITIATKATTIIPLTRPQIQIQPHRQPVAQPQAPTAATKFYRHAMAVAISSPYRAHSNHKTPYSVTYPHWLNRHRSVHNNRNSFTNNSNNSNRITNAIRINQHRIRIQTHHLVVVV